MAVENHKRSKYRGARAGIKQATMAEQALAVEGNGEKTLWEGLELLGTLAIPIVVAVVGAMFSAQQSRTQTESRGIAPRMPRCKRISIR